MRDELLTAMRSRLSAASRNPAAILDPETLTEAEGLNQILRDNESDLEVRYILGWLHWFRYLALPEGEDQVEFEDAITLFMPCFANFVENLPKPLLPILAVRTAAIAEASREDILGSHDPAVLAAALRLWAHIIMAVPESHPYRSRVLDNIAVTLQARSAITGDLEDLNSAIGGFYNALTKISADEINRPTVLSHLGGALRERYERTGSIEDLNTAIRAMGTALAVAPEGHPYRSGLLANLGDAMRLRYERTGELADLNQAINAGTQAATIVSPGERALLALTLSNVCNALRLRFERTGALTDLNEAVMAGQAAVVAAPNEYLHGSVMRSNLGIALRARYEATGSTEDLDSAIGAIKEAVAIGGVGPHLQAMYLSNLANALLTRYRKNNKLPDLEAAIDAAQAAHDTGFTGDVNEGVLLYNLAAALNTRFERNETVQDLNRALSFMEQAARLDSASTSMRIKAARDAARLVAPSDPCRAAQLMEEAVRMLPLAAPLQVSRGDQQHALGRFPGLASDAAALALADTSMGGQERATRALTLLEAGRAVLLSQAMDTRSDVTALHQQFPELAARFTALRDQLDSPGQLTDSQPTETTMTPAGATPRPELKDRRRMADELAAALREIRALDGFNTFGLPPTAEELVNQAAEGAVVTLNVSSYRSDALLLTSTGINALALPGLTADAVTDRVIAFHQALTTTSDPKATSVERSAAQAHLHEILIWLWDVALAPVLDALGHNTEPPHGAPWPRVWWVPSGLLGLLPLHAAGHHSDPTGKRRTVLDRVVSSYAPTVRALAYVRRQASEPAAHRALIVAMPITPGLPNDGKLNYALVEAEKVGAHLPDHVLLSTLGVKETEWGTQNRPTKENVISHLATCTIAHFACHGYTDHEDPSKSMLLLADYRDQALTVGSLAEIRLDHSRLAYLSACDTASIGGAVIDEFVHLASAFLLVGFPHVIGTLWAISDYIAVDIANSFYTALSVESSADLNTNQAAFALHSAIRAARERYPDRVTLWASHIHVGA